MSFASRVVSAAWPVHGLRASAHGRVLRIAVPARQLRPDVRLRAPLRWSLPATAALLALAVLAPGAAGVAPAVAAPPADAVALTEREPAGDVVSWISPPAGSFRPEVDLLAAGAEADGNRLRLRIVTEAPPLRTVLGFGASEAGCDGDQLMVEIRIDGSGAATVRATDDPDGRLRPFHAYAVTVDGNDLTLDMSLLAPPPLADWTVSATDLGATSGSTAFGDTLPDWFVEAAYFTRGTGTRNGPPPCEAPDPPLLPRSRVESGS